MKVFRFFIPIIMAFGLLGSPNVRASEEGVTLLIVPHEDGPVRVGMDVGNRFPTILLRYQSLPNGTVALQGWSGSEWVRVTASAYGDGSFLPTRPASALLIEKQGGRIPESLIPKEAWCPLVYKVKTAKIRPVIHLLGRHYDFRYKDWKWFSENYELPLNYINPEGLNIAWYQKQLGSHFGGNANAGMSDLQYLEVVRAPQLQTPVEPDAMEEPVLADKEQVAVPDELAPPADEETDQMVEDNPLTNAVPPAVILGARDAEETVSDDPVATESEKTEGQE